MLYVGNMALLINDVHIFYLPQGCHLVNIIGMQLFYKSWLLNCKAWVPAMFLFLDFMVLTGPFTYRYEKSFLGMVDYSSDWLPYYCIVAIANFLD